MVTFSGILDPGGRFVVTKENDGDGNGNGDSNGHRDGNGNNMTCNSSDGGEDSLVSFSGFLDPGGRFANMNQSVHCHHLPCFVRSDAESCHGCVEQISHQRVIY